MLLQRLAQLRKLISSQRGPSQVRPGNARRRLAVEPLEQRCMLAGFDANWDAVTSNPDTSRSIFDSGQIDDRPFQEINYINAAVVSMYGLPNSIAATISPTDLTIRGGTAPNHAGASSAAPLLRLVDFDSGSDDGEANQIYKRIQGQTDGTITLFNQNVAVAVGQLINFQIDTKVVNQNEVSKGNAVLHLTTFLDNRFSEIGSGPIFVSFGSFSADGQFAGFQNHNVGLPETIAAKLDSTGRGDVALFTDFEINPPNNTDFTIGDGGSLPWPARFSGGAMVGSVERPELYVSGTRAWMVNSNATGTIQFTGGPATKVEFLARAQSTANASTAITAYDAQGGVIDQVTLNPANFQVNTPFQTVSFTGLIDRIEVVNNATNGADGMNSIEDVAYLWLSDHGDAPDTATSTGTENYNTLATDFGPGHAVVNTLMMGTSVDGELDGQPFQPASGDDFDGNDDENGLVDPANDLDLVDGQKPRVRVRVNNATGATASLFGWIDYNNNGAFELSERASTTISNNTNGIATLQFPEVPLGFTGSTYARFRLSTDGQAAENPTGGAPDGEVEDYTALIRTAQPDKIGVHQGNRFLLDANNNGQWDGARGGDVVYIFGNPGDTPISGDWNGDGYDEIGVHRGNMFFLDFNGNGHWDGVDGGDIKRIFGVLGDTPIVGDWGNDGRDNIGVHRGNIFLLDTVGNGQWDGATNDTKFTFGRVGDSPIVGVWTFGPDKVGVKRGNEFLLDLNGDGQWNGTGAGRDIRHTFGTPSDVAQVGNFDGDRDDQIGVRRGDRFLGDNGNGEWQGPATGDKIAVFGLATDTGLVGRWRPFPQFLYATVEQSNAQNNTTALTMPELQPIVDAAFNIFTSSGLTQTQVSTLHQVEFSISDLNHNRLGEALGASITVDVNAAGYGWFIDATPHTSEDFSEIGSQGLLAAGDSAAAGQIDLLSVVLHELGHVLGLPDLHFDVADDSVMNEALIAGVRRLLTESDLAALVVAND